MRTTIAAVGGTLLLSIAVSGCGSPSGAPRPTSAVDTPVPPAAGGHDGLTDREYAAAVALARWEVRREHAHVTSATATVGPGRVTQPNTGFRCTSGRLLHLTLIGRFPHIVISPIDTRGGTVTAEDYSVHAVVLTADAGSSRACELGVQTGEVAPAPGATVLRLD